MSRCMSMVLGCCLVFTSAVRADDEGQKAAREILDRAIKAAGGAEALGKLNAVTWHAKSKITPGGDVTVDANEDWSVKGSDQFRVELAASVNGNNVSGTLVMKPDKAWGKGNDGKTNEVPKEAAVAIRNVYRAGRLVHQLPALRDKPFELAPLGELKIGEQETVGIRVAQKDRPEVSIYFDKKSGLPAKIEVRTAEMAGGQELLFEVFLSEYKDFDGIKHPTKMTLQRDGKTFLESEISDLKPQALDDTVFDKP